MKTPLQIQHYLVSIRQGRTNYATAFSSIVDPFTTPKLPIVVAVTTSLTILMRTQRTVLFVQEVKKVREKVVLQDDDYLQEISLAALPSNLHASYLEELAGHFESIMSEALSSI